MDLQLPQVSAVYSWLAQVKDPELPVLSILDLGIVRGVNITENGELQVTITPTYSGCPAMDVIAMNIRMALAGRGFSKVDVQLQLRPAWTTDWMSEEGKKKLKTYGIAPPQRLSASAALGLFEEDESIVCPRCNATDTRLVSRHGATACKAMYQCNVCHEPFEHFKCH
ncbi:MAG: phenylacetate-CoA oxygenase subunit PaaJ [Bacteroidetes bacterium]|nr:phenylacetate-CoA oxygenase subunit PaaJ [Bacteroidota bacterium]MBS1629290.1 phenylacetate-CoA oxygenase subunit PaaJ [Bacteroidota bacterium]